MLPVLRVAIRGRTKSWSRLLDSRMFPPVASSGNAGSARASSPGDRRGLDSIPPFGFGAIQGFVGRLQNRVGSGFHLRRTCHSDADRDREHVAPLFFDQLLNRLCLPGPPASPVISTVRPARLLPAICASHAKFRAFDLLAQLFQMYDNFGGGFSGKQDREFLASATVGSPTPGHSGQVRGNEPQHLISRVVAVGVVESLEVVDVDNGDRIWILETKQRVIEGSPRWQTGQFIVI